MLKKIWELTANQKFLAGCIGGFVTAYSFVTAADTWTFYTQFFAGATAATALFTILDDED